MALKNTNSFDSGYIVCQNSAMIRLNRRSPVIINMLSTDLALDRRVIKPLPANQIETLTIGQFVFHAVSSKAVEYLGKFRGDFAVVILDDTPTVSQLSKLKAASWIVLRNSGLYHMYNQDNEFYVKAENENKVYKQGQTNVIAKTNPIEPPSA